MEVSDKPGTFENEVNCVNDSQNFQDADEHITTLAVDQCHSHLL